MGQKTPIAGRHSSFRATDGVTVPAFVAVPEGAQAAPCVVIAPEIFGVSPWIEDVARMLAREGFRAIAPEIFARDPQPPGSDRAAWMARIARLSVPQAVADLRSALASLQREQPRARAPEGVIGFCLGGALAILTAAEGGLSACVDCYGRPRWPQKDALHPVDAIDAATRIRCPVLAVYGKRDAGIPVADAEALRPVLPAGSEVVFYEAGHAFLNDTRPDMYVADQATLAWGKIVGFLRRNLG